MENLTEGVPDYPGFVFLLEYCHFGNNYIECDNEQKSTACITIGQDWMRDPKNRVRGEKRMSITII